MAFDKLAYDRKWRATNPDKVLAATQRHRARNKEKLRAYNRARHLRETYGLSLADFEKKLKDQGGGCAACGATTPGHRNGWQVDHNHVTGAVRGILCCACNIGVGVMENAERVTKLRAYLEHYDAASVS